MSLEDGRLVADLVVENGVVLTVDAQDTVAEAVAVVGDEIVAVGSSRELGSLKGRTTQVLDLAGATLIPGMIDNHTHPLLGGLSAPEVGAKVDIQHETSIEGIKRRIAEAAARKAPGEWVTTSCMYRGSLDDGRFPDRRDLDEAVRDHPVAVMQGGKGLIVNSRALELAGIDSETPDPLGDPNVSEGLIARWDNGEPSGLLIAGAADLARKRWWERLGMAPKMWDFLYMGQETNVAALRAQMKRFNAAGITGTRDMGVGPEEIDAYVEIMAAGDATVRFDLLLGTPARYIDIEAVESLLKSYFGPKQGVGDDWLRIAGLKLVIQNDGWWSYSPEKMRRMVILANRLGWTLAIHGMPCDVTDSVELLLDVLEEADRERPIAGRRFSYEHGFGLLKPDHFQRFQKLGFLLAANPLLSYYAAARSARMSNVMNSVRLQKHNVDIPDPMERARREWGTPLRSWIDAGLVVTGGTDFPAVDYDLERPFLGFAAACTQATMVGELLPGEGVTPAEALRMWTINGAYASFQEHRKGSLEVGKLADMVVLSDNPLAIELDRLADIQVLRTIVGGKTVYEHGEAADAQ